MRAYADEVRDPRSATLARQCVCMTLCVQVADAVQEIHLSQREWEAGICIAGYSGGGMVAVRAAAASLRRGLSISDLISLSGASPLSTGRLHK